jgi:hypothetical protein
MITLKRAAALWPLLAVTVAATPAFSQAPSEAQRAAIKSECRSDYMAHCSSIPPGGAASLECLQKNMSSLAPGCQSAVRAVGAPAAEAKPESKPESAPATTEAKPAQEPVAAPAATPAGAPAKAAASAPANKPSSAQISAIRSACRSDYPRVCAGVPTGGAAALQCLEKNKSKVSASCQKAVAAVGGGAPAGGAAATAAAAGPVAVPAAAPAAAAAPALMLRPMRPREVLFVMRSACGGDLRALCPGVQPGGGRIIECLATQASSLSPACREVLAPFAVQ